MIQNGSLNQLNFQAKTELPNFNRALDESQQVISEHQSHPNHEAHSENLNNRDPNFTLQYKKQLIKLMVMVKFEKFGYRKNELQPIIQYYLDRVHNLDRVNNRHLSDEAGKVFLKVFSSLIGENWVQFRQESNDQNIMEEERQEEMPQQPIQRRILQPQRIIRIRPQHQSSILCNICYTTSNNYCEQVCGHSFCVDCMKGYLRQNLRSDNYIVKCPEYECTELVSLSTVKEMLTNKEYQRFIYFRQKNEKQMNPDNKFCSIPDCGQVLQSERNRLICPKCRGEYCEVCLQKYHEGQDCDVALRNQLEHTFQHFQIKKCPGCKSPIEKSDGCNHMTCKKCKYEFCWLCQKKYTKHHYRYYNCFGCPGMQYQNQDEILVQRLKQICLYMVLPVVLSFFLFCYIAGLPLYIIAKFIQRPCFWSSTGTEMAEYELALKMCCQKQTILFHILAWLFFQPRALFYALFVAPVNLTKYFCGELGSVLE